MTGKTKRNLRIAAVLIVVLTIAAVLYAAGIKTDPIKWGTNSIPLWGAVAAIGGGLSALLIMISSSDILAKFLPWGKG